MHTELIAMHSVEVFYKALELWFCPLPLEIYSKYITTWYSVQDCYNCHLVTEYLVMLEVAAKVYSLGPVNDNKHKYGMVI